MNNQNILTHVIAPGDTLYTLARKYNTTIETIIDANPYLDPQRLLVGDRITIYTRQNGLSANGITKTSLNFMANMRALLEDHIVWNRGYIVSTADNLRDTNVIDQRLLRNATGIGNMFSNFYGADNGNKITNLIRQHILFTGELVKALKRGDNVAVGNYDRELRSNVDEIAFTLDAINPYYDEENIRRMLYQHLDLIKSMAVNRLARNYAGEADDYDKARDQGTLIADYLTDGIIDQFPKRFI